MTGDRTAAIVLAALVALAAVPAGALALLGPGASPQATNESSVNVSTGQQLSTVLAVTSDDVQSEYAETAFEVAYGNGSEEKRAEAVAERAEELRERAEAIREDYADATEAYEAGELSRSEYARQLATLNARATNVVEAYERLRQRASNVSALELRAAGLNRSATRAAVSDLESVRGAGATALLQRFTGETRGEVELETAGGLSIEVTSEDGERSRELERPGDGSSALSVSQSDALAAARSTLSDANGTWSLTSTKIDRESGTHEFTFRLDGNDTVGEAEVEVDGSSGDAVSVEEEIEPRGDADEGADDEAVRDGEEDEDGEEDDAEREGDDRDTERDGELALVLAGGSPAPNETVTVRALSGGEPAANVTLTLDGERVGRTGASGDVSVTLPAGGEVALRSVRGEQEGELEFELGGDEDDREERAVYRNLSTDATLDGETATVTVRYDGSGVANATVTANDRRVGTTDADGTVSFAVPNGTEDLEVTVEKGEFEAEYRYAVQNGSLVRTESPGDDEGDDESESEDEQDEQDEETEGDEETESDDDSSGDGSSGDDDETEEGSSDDETETPEAES